MEELSIKNDSGTCFHIESCHGEKLFLFQKCGNANFDISYVSEDRILVLIKDE